MNVFTHTQTHTHTHIRARAHTLLWVLTKSGIETHRERKYFLDDPVYEGGPCLCDELDMHRCVHVPSLPSPEVGYACWEAAGHFSVGAFSSIAKSIGSWCCPAVYTAFYTLVLSALGLVRAGTAAGRARAAHQLAKECIAAVTQEPRAALGGVLFAEAGLGSVYLQGR